MMKVVSESVDKLVFQMTRRERKREERGWTRPSLSGKETNPFGNVPGISGPVDGSINHEASKTQDS